MDWWRAANAPIKPTLEDAFARIATLEDKLQRAEFYLKNVKETNVRLRLEIDRLGSPHSACNQEAAAWRWACGDQAQKLAVCELDGTEWIPVLSSRQALDIAAEDIREQNYSPLYTVEHVLRDMARTDIEI